MCTILKPKLYKRVTKIVLASMRQISLVASMTVLTILNCIQLVFMYNTYKNIRTHLRSSEFFFPISTILNVLQCFLSDFFKTSYDSPTLMNMIA